MCLSGPCSIFAGSRISLNVNGYAVAEAFHLLLTLSLHKYMHSKTSFT